MKRRSLLRKAATLAGGAAFFSPAEAEAQQPLSLPSIPDAKKRNIVLILTDDHRYDALGFMKRSFVETPHLDALAKGGVHLENAFVTTSLCSPSRASILTGQYAHRHRVVDNANPIPPGTTYFPQYLQKAGYQTAFIGKWHMGGDSAAPQPGFDRWVSFRGQGTYRPTPAGLNVDGKQVAQKGYITDELTNYALDWLKGRKKDAPFFLYLSHKGIHADFVPAPRHKGRFKNAPFTPPKTADPNTDPEGRPRWVQDQRYSWHGVGFPYHSSLDIAEYFRQYAETLLAVDDSVGKVMDFLRDEKLLDDTLVVYMGDNGFAFGEHGLIDKRTAYEESMRVPLLMHCPALIPPGSVCKSVVANIDIAPTFLAAAGLQAPAHMDGANFLPLARGKTPVTPWRDGLLYEYYWERAFPQTPTMHALRGDRYKYIRYQGVWDTDELYDLQEDPTESKNRIRDPALAPVVTRMNQQLFDILAKTEGMQIPLLADRALWQNNHRPADHPHAADFPPAFVESATLAAPAPGSRKE